MSAVDGTRAHAIESLTSAIQNADDHDRAETRMIVATFVDALIETLRAPDAHAACREELRAEVERLRGEVLHWKEGDGLTEVLNVAHARLREVLGPARSVPGPFPGSTHYESTVHMAERVMAEFDALRKVAEAARDVAFGRGLSGHEVLAAQGALRDALRALPDAGE